MPDGKIIHLKKKKRKTKILYHGWSIHVRDVQSSRWRASHRRLNRGINQIERQSEIIYVVIRNESPSSARIEIDWGTRWRGRRRGSSTLSGGGGGGGGDRGRGAARAGRGTTALVNAVGREGRFGRGWISWGRSCTHIVSDWDGKLNEWFVDNPRYII